MFEHSDDLITYIFETSVYEFLIYLVYIIKKNRFLLYKIIEKHYIL